MYSLHLRILLTFFITSSILLHYAKWSILNTNIERKQNQQSISKHSHCGLRWLQQAICSNPMPVWIMILNRQLLLTLFSVWSGDSILMAVGKWYCHPQAPVLPTWQPAGAACRGMADTSRHRTACPLAHGRAWLCLCTQTHRDLAQTSRL